MRTPKYLQCPAKKCQISCRQAFQWHVFLKYVERKWGNHTGLMDEGPSPIVFSFNWIKGTCFINRCYLGITCNTLVASIMQMLLHTCYMMLIFSAVTLVIVPSKTEFVNCFSHVLLSTFIVSQKIDQSHVMAIKPF